MAEIEDAYPLSPLQHGMVFNHLKVKESGDAAARGVDLEQLVGRLREPIDAEILRRAWSAATAHHAILRTRFRWDGERPRQEVRCAVDVVFESRVFAIQASSEEAREAELARFLRDDRRRGFDLAEAPLWRVTLLSSGSEDHTLVWTYSHALLDACFGDVLRDVFAAYDAIRSGNQPHFDARPSYRDHIVWQQQHLVANAEAARAFWRAMLAGFATPTTLDAIRTPRAAHAEHAADGGYLSHRTRIPRATSDAIRAWCAKEDLRVSTFVDAAWALVLAAFSGEDDVIFGGTRACRRSSIPGADRIVGLFINTLPVRAKVSPDRSLTELLRSLRDHQVAVRHFEHTPLVDAVACAELARGAALFDSIIVFNERDNDTRLKSFGDAWATREWELYDQTSFPLALMAYDEPSILLKLTFDPRAFTPSVIARMGSLLGALFDAFVQNPSAKLGDLPRLPPQDRASLDRARARSPVNAAHAAAPSTVHEAFEAQVDRTPDARALAFRDRVLTYRELDARANRVAAELRALGVGPDVMVGVFVERSLEMVIALFGILKAGGAYVPMDPAYPSDRIAWMLEDTKAPVVVTVAALREALPPGSQSRALCIDELTGAEAPRVASSGIGAKRENLAYVIFTSGSTGRPKGAMIEHRNVVSFFAGMDEALGTKPGVWLAVTSISFDISVLEIFWTLARGYTVVIQEEAERLARAAARPASHTRPIGFSLFYFAADAGEPGNKYRLLLEGAKFADANDFAAVWTPERHFHPFGGLYPNPAVTSAAVAAITKRVAIRAGSVVLPLHHPIRCAEEWSMVDNLSGGRVGLSFASGWHASDFALRPENFRDRREIMARSIETVRALWRGDAVKTTSGDGKEIEVRMYPPPVQKDPPIWITASGSPDTFRAAGAMGASILTNLLVMTAEQLVANIEVYREARRAAGHVDNGHITLMLHAYVARDLEEVRTKARGPFLEYLKTSTDLINKARWELTAFAKGDDRNPREVAGSFDLASLSEEEMNVLMEHAFQRYFSTAGLFGTPAGCLAMVDRLKDMGVDEIACLIDFGIDTDSVLEGLTHLNALRRASNVVDAAPEDQQIAAQIKRHGVTHLQCTPSLASMLVADEDALRALGGLSTLLLGGEALPVSLVARLRSAYGGEIRNMYGPTETTIWSSSARIGGAHEAITIGTPLADEWLYTIDRHGRPLPIGVPGELVIGGSGVVRGYLNRPELTAEKFIADPLDSKLRAYRTGDLARLTEAGPIDFLGRIDHQVKLRGYRIELGEIEATLGRHPAVRESVVVARTDSPGSPGDTRLVAYFVPRKGGDDAGTAAWQAIWDDTYKQESSVVDPLLHTLGWKSSFTGEQIPQEEMRDWVERTVARILESKPRRVLEIGCGTGMLLMRIARQCESFVGIDFSQAALAYVEAQLAAHSIGNVTLERRMADAVGEVAGGPFDVVVLNSIIQYFPDVDYLVRVLEAAYAKLAPGGTLFVGDVRSLAHLDVFQAAVELSRARAGAASGAVSAADLRARTERRAKTEGELVVDAALFEALRHHWPDVADVRIELKSGTLAEEMTRYRYDVFVRKAGGADAGRLRHAEMPEVRMRAGSIDKMRALLASAPDALRVVGVPNARLVEDVAAADFLLKGTRGEVAEGALDPDEARAVDPAYDAQVTWSAEGRDRFDVLFRRRGAPARTAKVVPGPRNGAPPRWQDWANQPARRAPGDRGGDGDVAAELRRHLRDALPEYMVPSAFVALDALPLTPNGKIDRKALPAPSQARSRQETTATFAAPTSDVERDIAGVWRDLLGSPEIGIDDNFFDLGANSLMMVQASARLRAVLGKPVSLVQLFQFTTVRALAGALGGAAEAAPEEAQTKQAQERGQTRRDAMARRREVRRGTG